MAFLIGGANSAADDAYEVANSCRFNNDDSDHMHKTPGSAGNRRTWTVSVWVKKSLVGGSTRKAIFGTADTEVNGDGGCLLRFENGDALKFESDGGQVTVVETNALYRDPSAWMHVVLAVDTTQGTAANRVKIYINGVQETSLATSTYPAQNKDYHWNNTVVNYVGAYDDSGDIAVPFDGYMAEFVSIDGSALTPSSFGEYNEDSPTIWQPIDVSGLTFGTNGFYLDFEDSANLGNDANGGTGLTEVNLAATNQATDSPTNNFCTLNPLDNNNATNLPTLFEGNLDVLSVSDSTWSITPGTIALPKSGKWYYEVEAVTGRAGDRSAMAGWANPEADNPLSNGSMFSRNSNGNIMQDDSSIATGYTTWHADGDILGCYIDMDNSKLYWAMNGTIQASGTGISFAGGFDDADFIIPMVQVINLEKLSVNFGNPATNFAIASGNQDANGYGNFEFDPSSGTFDGASKDFYAICTKNLAEFG